MKNLKADLWAWLLFVLAWTYIALNFSSLPERVPVHYDFRGVPDRYGHPSEIFVNLVIMVPYFFLLMLNPQNMNIKGEQSQQTFAQVQQYGRLLLVLLPTSIALGEVLTWQGLIGSDGLMKVLFTMLGIFFVLIGNVSPRVTRNSFTGFRTAYSLRSDLAWYDVNRKFAYLMTLCGVLVVVLTWVLPAYWPIFGLLGSVAFLLLGTVRLHGRARTLWEQDPKRIALEDRPF